MRTRFGFCQARAALALRGAGSGANTIEVRWVEVSGGTVDPGTGGRIGGTRTAKSGTLRALADGFLDVFDTLDMARVVAADFEAEAVGAEVDGGKQGSVLHGEKVTQGPRSGRR